MNGISPLTSANVTSTNWISNTVTATLRSTMPLTAWMPLQDAAGAFRDECSSLEQTAQELFADLDRLSVQLEAKADELEEGRRHLAERGRQLAEQRKESARLSHQLEQQETQLSEALAEIRELRGEFANRPEPAQISTHAPEVESLRCQVSELQIERAVLLERLEAAAKQSLAGDASAPQVLSADSLQLLSEQFAKQLAGLQQRIQDSLASPSASDELTELKQSLLEQQQTQLQGALQELREMRAELTSRAEAHGSQDSESAVLRQKVSELEVERAVLLERLESAVRQTLAGDAPALPGDAFEAFSDQFAQQFAVLQSQLQALQQDHPELAELDSLRKDRLELEAELDLVRGRSAELQETIAQQKRELASQRNGVSEELQELRALIAQQNRVRSEREPVAPAAPPPNEQSQHAKEPSSPLVDDMSSKNLDPIVNSVMAQFAKLQKDISQRRKKK